MSKLSELVKFRTLLKSMNLRSEFRQTLNHFDNLWRSINEENPIEQSDIVPTSHLLAGMRSMKSRLQEIEQNIENEIKECEGNYYVFSDESYIASLHDPDEYILGRQIPLTTQAFDILTNKIRSASAWQYPGAFIRPGTRHLIEEMASSDPLYIVDTSAGLLESALKRFHDQYQKRIRDIVLVNEHGTILRDLPEGQLGLIVCLDFFEYRPIHLVEKYLLEFDQCLRPGGTVIFSFNNCDIEHGVNMVDKKFRTYTPAHRIKEMLDKLQYHVIEEHDHESSLSWLEAKKPGELKSLRGGQALAKINPKEIDS
jgi:SAM-dependent methyltransferase